MKRYDDWAMPVRHNGWAMLAEVTEHVKVLSGYRLCVRLHHRAWLRAVGVPR